MKKYTQSIVYVLFVLVTFFVLSKAFTAYQNPFDFLEHPLVWLALLGFIAVVILKEVVSYMATNKVTELHNEKAGIVPETVDSNLWIKKLLASWTRSKEIEQEEEIILDHNYDGIRELDNTLPPWWVYMFYATIVFAVVYLVRFEILGGDTQEMEYEKAVAQAKIELKQYKSTATDLITSDNVVLLTDAKDLARGKAVYNLNCASCHLGDGGGSIGPNLTDDHWILGGGIKNVFNTLLNGGRAGKGMISWKGTLKPEDMAKVSSYVLTLQGTTPAKGKAPEGEIWVDTSQQAPQQVSEDKPADELQDEAPQEEASPEETSTEKTEE